MTGIALALFDIGGVLGSNGWDHEQRSAAVDRFHLDADDFQNRHEETVGALEAGVMSLDEYLGHTIFCEPRDFSHDEFKAFMFAQSKPWPDSIAVVSQLAKKPGLRLATLNNEGEALNIHRIRAFGLCPIFPTFFSSCWLGVRKPSQAIYHRVLGMTQADPDRTVFVDDRLQNLAPAKSLGIHTIQFKSASQLKADLASLGL